MTMPRDPFEPELPSRRRASRIEELRMAWRDACADLRLAYVAWLEAGSAHKGAAFTAHLAASDREAAAATFYLRAAMPMQQVD
jgi:hypothetical protein